MVKTVLVSFSYESKPQRFDVERWQGFVRLASHACVPKVMNHPRSFSLNFVEFDLSNGFSFSVAVLITIITFVSVDSNACSITRNAFCLNIVNLQHFTTLSESYIFFATEWLAAMFMSSVSP